MKKGNFRERMSYKFDNLMSKGTVALVAMLCIITAVVVIAAGIIAFFIDGSNAVTPLGKIWQSLMHAIDAGTIAGDEGNFLFMLLMSLVTICGIFITSMLIGIINTGLESKMASLRKGNSKVLESGHTVIIGYNDNVFPMLSELIIANENAKNPVVVVLGEEEKEIMEDAIKDFLPDTKNTRIICRSGETSNAMSMERCSIEKSASIIINEHDDFATIKSILSVTNLLKSVQAMGCKAHITATICNKKNLDVAAIAGEGRAEILYFNDSLSRIIAHTCRQPGLSEVFLELFDFDGDEIYCEQIDGVYGKSFSELITSFDKSSIIGLIKDGEVKLNPNNDTIYEKGDSIILIASDDNVSFPVKDVAEIQKELIMHKELKKSADKDKILVIGYNELLEGMLLELDNYVVKGSEVSLLTTQDTNKKELTDLQAKLEKIDLSIFKDDIFELDILTKYATDGFKNIILLSDTSCSKNEADSKTLLLLLYLREISQKCNCYFSITSEMLQIRHQELAKATRVNDFVISSNITGLITTQISQNRSLHAIFDDLLDEEGSEIYMKPAGNYVKTDAPVSLFTVYQSATQRNETAIGYKKFKENDSFEIVVNPNKSTVVTFSADDLIITIAEC